MWAAWIVAAIALAGAAFMLRVLIAFLGERAPSVCYWVVSARTETLREVVGAWSDEYVEEEYRTEECKRGEYEESLENGNYAKKECSSGLIGFDVRPVHGGLGFRSIRPRPRYVFREHRL
jgi:hypothetical protein